MKLEKIKQLASDAGWYEGRKINVDYMINILKRSGYITPNELIIRLLEEFWDIKIRYTFPDGYETDVFFNIDEAIANTTNQRSVNITNRIKDSVIPVGTMIDTYYVIWVSYSGEFYISQLDLLYYVGDNIFSLMNFAFSDEDIALKEIGNVQG